MKQPTIQCIDICAHLSELGLQNQFDSDCQRLESKFRFIELLDQTKLHEDTKPVVAKPLASYPTSPTVLEEQLCLMKDLCLRMALHFENYDKIVSELLSSLDDAICLLSLVRSVVLSGLDPDMSQLREMAVLLVKSVFALVLKEDTIYSRRCLQSLTAVFSIESSGLTGEDFLRSVVWDLCFTKLERGTSSNQSADGTFGEIRRGGTSHPSIQPADQIQEEKRSSLFDSSMLTDHEAWQVELYRLLATVSSPVDPSEATRPDYQAMKTDLLRALSNAGTDPTSYFHLHLGSCLLRAYCRAPVQTLSIVQVVDLVDLISGLGHQFVYDYEAASAVLQLLPLIAAHVSNANCSASKAKIISLFLRFQTGVQEEMFGPPVEEAYYQCLASLPLTADWLTWGAGTLSTDGKSPICLETLAGLNRPFNSTMIATCQAIHQLFDGNTVWQDTILAALSSAVVTKEFTVEDQRDVATRSAAILQLLCSIMVKSSWAEKPALVMMLRFARYHSLDIDVVQRALELAARQLNLDCHGWLDSRLEFLLDRWLDADDLSNFPFGIYHCSSLASFVEKHQNVIVPVVFLKTDLQKVGQLAQLVLKDPSDLLCQHLPAIVAKILPRLSEAKLQRADVPVTLNRFAQTKYQEIQQVLMDRNRISLALKNGLLELLTRLLFTVHDSNVAGQLFGPETVLPLTGSFRFEKQAVIDAVRHFSPDVIADANVEPFENLVLLTGTNPSDIHTLLVELFVAYEAGCRLTDKQQALVNLSVASDLLVKAMEEHQQKMLFYIFYSLVHRMGHIIRQEEADETLRRGAMIIVKGLVVKVIKSCPDFVAQLMVTIVGFVTPLAKTPSELQWLAMDILDFLVVEHRSQLEEAASQLSPFPNLPQFAHLSRALEDNKQNRTLNEEIGAFLGLVDQLGYDNVPVESVAYLGRLLAKRKKEVMELYVQLESGTVSSSDCIRGSLHRLVCCLIQLGKSKSSLTEAVAAALGELGPADLTTLILQPDLPVPDTSTVLGQMENHAQAHSHTLQLAVAVFPPLVRYLFADESVQLVGLAGKVMLAAMDSVEGQQFYALAKKYCWRSLTLLLPFRNQRHGAVEQKNLFLDIHYFDNNIDDPTLWTPSKAGHSSWLVRLTCTLIGAFSSPNFYATLLPVCRLQPEFCSILLPFVVRSMLSSGDHRIRDVISMHVNAVLSRPNKMAEPSVKSLLQVVQHLRSQKQEDKKADSYWDRNFRLSLNYLDAARAAQSCSAYFSTV